MRSLIFVYDFDGTLTPYSSPQYKILKDCGYDDIKMDELVSFFTSKGFDLHEAFLEAVYDIFKRFDVPLRIETFCEGAQDIEFNKGILEFFNKFKRLILGIMWFLLVLEMLLVSQKLASF